MFELGSGRDEGASVHGRLAGREEHRVRAGDNRRLLLPVRNRLAEVVGGKLGGIDVAVGCNLVDPLGHAAMQVAALVARQRAVGDIPGERVLERKLAQPRHDGVRLGNDQSAPAQGGDLVLVDAHRRRPEDAPHDGTAPQGIPLTCLEQIHPRRDDAVDRIRNPNLGQAARCRPCPTLPLESALLDQHLQHLLDEERVALGARQDRRPHVVGRLGVAEQRRDEP